MYPTAAFKLHKIYKNSTCTLCLQKLYKENSDLYIEKAHYEQLKVALCES